MLIKVSALFVSFWWLNARAALTSEVEVDKRGSGTKVVGGEKSPVHYPHQASLQIFTPGFGLFARNSTHICGGSILSENFFLTAAHCVSNVTVSKLSVLVGTSRLKDASKGSRHAVASCVIHPNYVSLNSSDLALCNVKKAFEFGENIGKIDIERSFIGPNANATITGWGSISMIRWLPIPFYNLFAYPDQLQRAFLPIISNEDCSKQISVDNSQICTFSRFGQGACAGDSGGPLTLNGKLIGIISFGTSICASGRPDVFTRISHFYDWIAIHMTIPSAAIALAAANATIQAIISTLPAVFNPDS